MMVFISEINNYMFRSEDGRYRLKHVVIYYANKYHHLAYNYSCVF